MNESIEDMIRRHESYRDRPYKDTVGKLTIGYGRNLTDRGIRIDEAELMLKNDIEMCRYQLEHELEYFDDLPYVIQLVLQDMCYNLGITKLLRFKRMLRACFYRQWQDMAREMQESIWYEQVGNRSRELRQLVLSLIL